MDDINQLLQGVLLGGYYALLACGLSFMYGVMRIINLAHGSLAIVAAYLIFLLADHYHLHPFLGLVLVLPVMAVFGWILHRLVLERSARAGELVPLLATFGLSGVLDNTLFQQFGADTRSLAPYIDTLAYDSWILPGGLVIGQLSLLIFVVAAVLLGGLQLMLRHTPLGYRIRAASEDPATAELVGVNARTAYTIASAIAIVTVAIAGCFLAMRATFDPYAGPIQLIFAFEALIIGGTRSLWGTLWGGILLGVAQSIGAMLHPEGFLIAGHLVFLVFLLLRAYGRPRFWRRRHRPTVLAQ